MEKDTIGGLRKIPRTLLGVTELRRNPQRAFDLARKRGLPILVTEFSQPQGILLSLETFDDIVEVLGRLELEDALDSVEVYRRERSEGALKKLRSLKDLLGNGN